MLRGYWNKHRKAGLIGLAIVAALALGFGIISQGLSRDAMYKRQADESSREHARHADDQIRQSCFPLAGKAESNCVQKARQAYRTERRNELDLVAQRKSANWAFIMGGAAVLGMVLSAIGVALVWITFAETRRANEIAEDSHEVENRPVLTFEFTGFKHKPIDGRGWWGSPNLLNIGKGPALIKQVDITVHVVPPLYEGSLQQLLRMSPSWRETATMSWVLATPTPVWGHLHRLEEVRGASRPTS